ncbi:MAG: hypothetical protein LBI69_01335 [Puniceicoccales bacterium]|nr:hypothetical protein [Puniceicoccales bacterium]
MSIFAAGVLKIAILLGAPLPASLVSALTVVFLLEFFLLIYPSVVYVYNTYLILNFRGGEFEMALDDMVNLLQCRDRATHMQETIYHELEGMRFEDPDHQQKVKNLFFNWIKRAFQSDQFADALNDSELLREKLSKCIGAMINILQTNERSDFDGRYQRVEGALTEALEYFDSCGDAGSVGIIKMWSKIQLMACDSFEGAYQTIIDMFIDAFLDDRVLNFHSRNEVVEAKRELAFVFGHLNVCKIPKGNVVYPLIAIRMLQELVVANGWDPSTFEINNDIRYRLSMIFHMQLARTGTTNYISDRDIAKIVEGVACAICEFSKVYNGDDISEYIKNNPIIYEYFKNEVLSVKFGEFPKEAKEKLPESVQNLSFFDKLTMNNLLEILSEVGVGCDLNEIQNKLKISDAQLEELKKIGGDDEFIRMNMDAIAQIGTSYLAKRFSEIHQSKRVDAITVEN